jgi:hypothetical protein
MKPRAKWLNDELMGCKPARHQDKKRKVIDKAQVEETKAAKHRKWVLSKIREQEADEE